MSRNHVEGDELVAKALFDIDDTLERTLLALERIAVALEGKPGEKKRLDETSGTNGTPFLLRCVWHDGRAYLRDFEPGDPQICIGDEPLDEWAREEHFADESEG